MSKTQLSKEALKYFREQGSRGGTIGNRSMTAAEKKTRALKASQAAAVARTKKAREKKSA